MRRLAHDLRKFRATGLMTAHEPELTSIAAADERRRVIAAATERKKSLAAFYYEVDTAVSQNLSIDACRSLAARLHDFRHDPLLQHGCASLSGGAAVDAGWSAPISEDRQSKGCCQE